MLYPLVRSLLFRLDAEEAHELTVDWIRRFQSSESLLRLLAAHCDPGRYVTSLLGLTFRSPVGIAAGFDKNAELIPFLSALGFGFVEVGTVTLRPQAGNPRPRLFRVPSRRAVINRMGFNNDGADVVAERLRRWRSTAPEGAPPVFVNVGKNREVALDDAPEAYAACLRIVAPHADACVVNVSSPNTPSLRQLQQSEPLVHLLKAAREACGSRPLLVKIAPDVSEADLDAICEVAGEHADGMICTNTTVDPLPGISEAGGVSGAPLLEKSTAVLSAVRRRVGEAYPLIGVGGIFTAEDVRRKIAAGANLVQLYTGFIYEGPMVARRLAREAARNRVSG